MIKRILLTITILIGSLGVNASFLEASTPDIVGPSIIQKEKYQVLTLADILGLYSSDVGFVLIEEDNYTGNGATIGIYELKLKASNLETEVKRTIEIQVVETLGFKVRAVTDYVNIHIAKSNKLTAIEIAKIHSNTGVFNINHTSQYQILTDNYSESYNVAGKYLFEYRVMDATGFDRVISSYITVYDSERIENNPIIIIQPRKSIFDNLIKVVNSILIVVAALGIGYIALKLIKKGRKLKWNILKK